MGNFVIIIMANIKSVGLITILLALAVTGDHCVDEKNDFRIVEVEIAESSAYLNQAMISVAGYFANSQYVNSMTFDYTLDGVNWYRSVKTFNQEYESDIFSVFTISISIEDEITPNAQAVVGFTEDSDLIWCSLINLAKNYENRRLLS
jgi:hypothetical protein